MPVYSYTCEECGPCESICSYAERDNQKCDSCGRIMMRAGVEYFRLGQPSYQMKAIMGNGEKVAGHFNRVAPKKTGWRRP